MLAPLMGVITDRTGQHRLFYLSGYVLLAVGLALFPFTQLLWFWMGLAFLQGVGSGTSNTVAAMFIVEYNPKSEWDARIGWLQTFYGVGQAAGLGLASILQARPEIGLLVSAGLMAPAILLGARGLPPSHAHQKPEKTEFSRHLHRPPRTVYSTLHRYEGAVWKSLRRLFQEWRSRFGVYIAGWFFVMLATWLIGALFPLLMKGAFNISYSRSALYYAFGAVIGIFAYTPSGTLGKRIGDGWVVIIGTIMTVISLAALSTLAYLHSGLNQWLVPVMYILIPIAWSPLIVGGTAWAAQLATFEEGEALGSYNATTAVAAVVAAFGAGLLAHNFGYGMILVVATVASVLAVVCFIPLLSSAKRV
jgi:MFS family permease